ncbi:MAG: SDR family oxidoreductase [Alphaproteobacteria bacterium]|nr:SDR family oxidoreductase [Alphaproteobacteria bacterium]MBV9375568.1 SDR family oxidoreductase [Alphaproteobacteria bacterium]MBV9815369.1 SDR family oxidoreductase [Alphaproteobacteria bacterium]
MVDFTGTHIVVTGGTGALGRAVIGRLRGANAICHVPNLIAAELDGFPFAGDTGVRIVRDVDVADEAAVKQFYGALPPLWASIHLAGGFAMAPILEISAADFTAQFRMNTLSCFLCSAAAVAAFRARTASGGGAPGGRIVNVAARPALEPRLGAGMTAYTASKSAVAALTQALAQELTEEQIWVNAVAPSILDTPANRTAMPDADYSRWVSPADAADVIVFLASPENRVTRGAVIPVYGGS